MKNEDRAKEIANNCSTHIVGAEVSDETYITTEPDCYRAAIEMAKWKDKQFAEEKQQLIDKIERVINNCLGGYVIRNFLTGDSYRINELAKDIRKAMEE